MEISPLKITEAKRHKKEKPSAYLDDSFRDHVARRNVLRNRILYLLKTLDELPSEEEFSNEELNKALGEWGEKFPGWIRTAIKNCLNIPKKQIVTINNMS